MLSEKKLYSEAYYGSCQTAIRERLAKIIIKG